MGELTVCCSFVCYADGILMQTLKKRLKQGDCTFTYYVLDGHVGFVMVNGELL